MLPPDRFLLGTASVEEAKRLRDVVADELGIALILERNPDCRAGCPVKIDIYAEREHEGSLRSYFDKRQAELANDPNAYDPSKETARCPACGTEFSTKLTECPDCGLGFGVG